MVTIGRIREMANKGYFIDRDARAPGQETTCRCFLHRQDTGWSRLCVPVLRWSCELESTQ
jgi:hypothetical protein